MATTLSLEQILERISEMKQETSEKDEVIRDQQMQIEELEGKLEELGTHCRGLESKIVELNDRSRQAEELLERLSQVLS